MKNQFLFSTVIILLIEGCSSPESIIKKDLDSRFTKFEVVEIKKDSSNVYDANMVLMGLKIEISQANVNMAKAESRYYDKIWTYEKTSHFMDSTTSVLRESCMKFMDLMSSKAEPCYYVKYRIHKDELKIEKEEYYYLRESDVKLIEAIHRPCNWSDFLKEENCDDLLGQCFKYYNGFLESIIR